MKKFKVSKFGFLAIGVVFALALSLVFAFNNKISAFAMETDAGTYIVQSENFADDSVVVVLDASISKINKIHNAKFFGGIEVESIKDLTQRKINMDSKNTDFKQILKINLQEHSKENVVASINLLNKYAGCDDGTHQHLQS